MFNSQFTQQVSRKFAERLRREAGDDVERQVALACQLALCREPSDKERAMLCDFVAHESLEECCRVVLNLNEFVYPE